MSAARLLGRYVPAFDFSERHSCRATASRPAILRAIAAYRPEDDPFFRVMIGLREAPMRLGRWLTGSTKPPPQQFGLHSFTLLEASDNEVVYGLVGRFWKADFALIPIADGPAFLAYDAPGVPKLALGFEIAGDGPSQRLVTETRVHCPDAASRRSFAPYWYLIRPVSGLIRRRILRSIRIASERPAS